MLYPRKENSVFYNPVQVQNRDLSVLMLGMYAERRAERNWTIRKRKEVRRAMLREEEEEEGMEQRPPMKKKEETKEERKARTARFEASLESRVIESRSSVDFAKMARESSGGTSRDGMSVLEALAASGLRSLRYWGEVPGIRTIVVNDLDPVAVEMGRENAIRNGLANELVDDNDDGNRNNNDEEEEDANDNNRDYVNLARPGGIVLQAGDATHEMYVSRLPPKLPPSQRNPTQLRHQKPQFDVIDLDPYGSAAPFLDAALQAVSDGGLLAITCTDMAALGGSHPETCYGRYGAFPVQRAGYLQELALRILLYHVSIVAGRYGRTIRPVLSVGMAFYCRVFVEVYDDKAGVNDLSLNHGHLFQSVKCSSFHVTPVATNEYIEYQRRQQQAQKEQEQSNGNTDGSKDGDIDNKNDGDKNTEEEGGDKKRRKKKKKKDNRPSNVYRNGRAPSNVDDINADEPLVCAETGGPYKMGGPLWIGPLHDVDVVNDAVDRLEAAMANDGVHPSSVPAHPLHTAKTLHGLLVAASEELPNAPLYHLLPNLCSAVNSATIPMRTFRVALVNAGYKASAYHKDPNAVKTDAPDRVVWDVVRAWCKEHPPAERKGSKRHQKGEEKGSNAPINGKPKPDVATMILSREIRTEGIDFTIPKGFEEGRRKGVTRWALNPEANWGPKKAASGSNRTKRKQEEEEAPGDGAEEPCAKQTKTSG